MTRLIRLAVLALTFVATSSYAQPFAGAPFALTNTRYAPAEGAPLLVSNGREVVLFWSTGTRIRATRLASGEAGPSHSVAHNSRRDSYSVVWTGSHFLMVIGQTQGTGDAVDDDVFGQLIDASGEALGAPFLLYDGGAYPRIAFDGTTVLMLFYRPGLGTDEIHALRLAPNGKPLDASPKPTGVVGGLQGMASNGRSFAAIVADRFERKVVLFDRGGAMTSLTPLVTDWLGFGAIASDGRRYLVADNAGRMVSTQFIEADGTAGAPLELTPTTNNERYLTSLAWSGSRWVVAYAEDEFDAPESFVVLHLNATTRAVEQREEGVGNISSMAGGGGRLTLAWLPERPGPIHVAQSSIAAGTAATASYASAEQKLRATANARHGTLVLWHEGGRLHAGVRGFDGSWTENELALRDSVFETVAASDGEGFAVIGSISQGRSLIRLDRDGALLNEVRLDWEPQHILWTGRDYVLYNSYTGVDVARLSKTGTLSPRRTVDFGARGLPTLASNGNGFYAIWTVEGPFRTPPMPPMAVEGILLDDDFKPLEVEPRRFASNEAISNGAAAWDGTQYVVIWAGEKGVHAARISPLGIVSRTQRISSAYAYDGKVQAGDGGVIIDWLQEPDTTFQLGLAFLRSDGALTTPYLVPPPSRFVGMNAQQVVAIAGGNAAVVESAVVDDAPVDGAIRLRATIVSRNALVERPAAPRLNAPAQGRTIELRWSAPSQPVSGYRIESRRDGGAWIEIGDALPAHRTSVTIDTDGKKTALRVRAWNDAGPGLYSEAVVVNAGKRRAAR